MRILGLGSKVMEKLGVKTQVVSFKDIHSAFKKGQIDAAEFGYPHIDHLIGMHKSAKYYYFPGWQQQFTVVEFITQKKKWDGLSKAAKAIIETSCNAHYLLALADNLSRQLGYDKLKRERIQMEMTLVDYECLLSTFDKEFGLLVTLWR